MRQQSYARMRIEEALYEAEFGTRKSPSHSDCNIATPDVAEETHNSAPAIPSQHQESSSVAYGITTTPASSISYTAGAAVSSYGGSAYTASWQPAYNWFQTVARQ